MLKIRTKLYYYNKHHGKMVCNGNEKLRSSNSRTHMDGSEEKKKTRPNYLNSAAQDEENENMMMKVWHLAMLHRLHSVTHVCYTLVFFLVCLLVTFFPAIFCLKLLFLFFFFGWAMQFRLFILFSYRVCFILSNWMPFGVPVRRLLCYSVFVFDASPLYSSTLELH